MTPDALLFMALSIILLWGGLVASVIYLRQKSSVDAYPPGGEDDDARPAEAPPIRDT